MHYLIGVASLSCNSSLICFHYHISNFEETSSQSLGNMNANCCSCSFAFLGTHNFSHRTDMITVISTGILEFDKSDNTGLKPREHRMLKIIKIGDLNLDL